MSLAAISFQFSAFGFSGSRHGFLSPVAASRIASLIPQSASVFVGCARGVDSFFRGVFPGAAVFAASSFGSGRSAFARRSIAVVQAVQAANGLWVAFPSSPCPAGLLPSPSSSACFCGSGSGSWASLAFALGSGVPCLVFLGSLPCPAGWELAPVPGCQGWFACSLALGVCPPASQLSLF